MSNIIVHCKKKWNNALFLLIGLLLAVPIIMAVISQATMRDAMLFTTFQVFLLLIPGIALVELFKIKVYTNLERVALGYALGYTLNIISYYFTVPFGGKVYLNYVLILEAIIAICYLIGIYRKKGKRYTEDYVGNIICLLFLLFMVAAKIILYYGVNRLPVTEGTENFFTADILYYLGNTIELSKGYPPVDFRWYSQAYKYHYWGSLQLATIKLFMNTSAITLDFCFGFMQGPILLVLAGYVMLKRLTGRIMLLIWGMLSLLVTSGFELVTFATYTAHLYIAPFGFDIGLAFVIYTFYFMEKQITSEKIQWNLLVCALLMLAVATGSKAPTAVILMVSLGLICAYELLFKRHKRAFLYGIAFLFIFVFIYFTEVSSGFSTINSSKGLSFAWIQSIKESGLWLLYTKNTGAAVLRAATVPFIVFIYILACNPNLFLALAMNVVHQIRKTEKTDIVSMACLLTSFIGVGFSMIAYQDGKSQLYFLTGAYPFAVMYCVSSFERWGILYKKDVPSKKARKKILIAMGICTIMGIIIMPIQYRGYIKHGLVKVPITSETIYNIDQVNLMTNGEYEAYNWVRTNTPEDALIVSNVVLQKNQGRSFITGVVTERHVWLEGWEYGFSDREPEEVERKKTVIERVMQSDKQAVAELRADGVCYIVQIKRLSEQFKMEASEGKKVFDNQEVAVYQFL